MRIVSYILVPYTYFSSSFVSPINKVGYVEAFFTNFRILSTHNISIPPLPSNVICKISMFL